MLLIACTKDADGTVLNAAVPEDKVIFSIKKLSEVGVISFINGAATTQKIVDALYGFYTSSNDECYTSENSLVLTGNGSGKKAGLAFADDNKSGVCSYSDRDPHLDDDGVAGYKFTLENYNKSVAIEAVSLGILKMMVNHGQTAEVENGKM